jgi:two-component system response regulator HydG
MPRILVIDDHDNSRYTLSLILKKEGYGVIESENGSRALQILKNDNFDLIITDLKMEKVDGFDIIDYVKKSSPTTEVIVITAYATIQTAVKAIKLGAYDYIAKPMQREEIIHTVKKALEKARLVEEISTLKRQFKEENVRNSIIGKSKPMIHVMKLVKEVADLDIPVLLLGESGTGKDLIARAIHLQSKRKDKPYIAINCGALPENLLESELFGHVKGAFTSASVNKKGLFKEAEEGTLFLDEIGEMSLSAQAKLLRTVEHNEIRPVGGNQTIKVNTRLICATNSDLNKKVDNKLFRSDLLYRINVFPIKLAPLRERGADIRLLANYFLIKYSKKFLKNVENIEKSVYTRLESYPWPGNVRELENIIERAVILAQKDTITDNDIPIMIENVILDRLDVSMENRSLSEIEKDTILSNLEKNKWNKIKTAKDLGISSTTLWRKIKLFGLSQKE